MEEQQPVTNISPIQPNQELGKSHSKLKPLSTIASCLALIVLVFFGTYVWQHNKLSSANKKVASLQVQLSTAIKQSKPTQSTRTKASNFTYSPSLGGLSVTLPKSYDVLVGADGNDGGAPGVDFKIVPLATSNISSDWDYTQEAEIQIEGFTSLNNAVSLAEAQMQQKKDCSTLGSGSCNTTDFSVSNTTIGGQPAKLIIAKAANEYLGSVNVYVGGLGNWGYTITSNDTTQPNNNTPGTLLATALKGISLKQANWP